MHIRILLYYRYSRFFYFLKRSIHSHSCAGRPSQHIPSHSSDSPRWQNLTDQVNLTKITRMKPVWIGKLRTRKTYPYTKSVFNSVFQRFFGPRAWRSKNEVPERRVELVRRAEPPGEKHVVSVEWKCVCLRVSRRFQGWISHSLTVAQTNSVKHNRAVNHLPLKLDFHFSLSSKHITCYSTRWKGLPGLGKCLLCSTHPQTILST